MWLSPQLLEDPGFRDQLGLPPVGPDPRVTSVVDRILREEPLEPVLRDAAIVSSSVRLEEMAEALQTLARQDAVKLLHGLYKAARHCRLDRSPSGRPVSRLLEALMPNAVHAVEEVVAGGRRDRLVASRAVPPEIIDLLVAQRRGRPASWERVGQRLVGSASLWTGSADTGMDPLRSRKWQVGELLSKRVMRPFVSRDAPEADMSRALRVLDGILAARDVDFEQQREEEFVDVAGTDLSDCYPPYLVSEDAAEILDALAEDMQHLGIVRLEAEPQDLDIERQHAILADQIMRIIDTETSRTSSA